ncbi:MAG: MFS transporter [Chloroflexi bacterium]|nr:MFS transporter [Chloroflexota bacterium]
MVDRSDEARSGVGGAARTPALAPSAGLRARLRPFYFYGWVICLVGFTVNMIFGAMMFHAFGTYVVLLKADFGWSATSFALAFSLMRIESGLLGPVEGWAIDRFGPRAIMRVGVVIFALGMIGLSRIDSLLTFYAAFLAMALGSALGAFLPISVAIVNWFDRRRVAALAMLSLGFAAGGLIQPLVVGGLEHYGWRQMSLMMGLLVLVVGLPLAQLVRHRPESHGRLPDGVAPEEHARRNRGRTEMEFTPRQALRTRAFWMLSLGQSASLLVFGAVSVHFVAYATETVGMSKGGAASMIALMTGATVAAQLVVGGLLGDRLPKLGTIVFAMFGHTVALFILAFGITPAWVAVFAVINGLAMGTRAPLMQALRADYFGRKSFGTIMGFSSLVMMFGIVTGPLAAGLSYDILGEYRPAFVLLGVLSAGGSVFFMLAKPPRLPDPMLARLPDAA